MSIDAFAADDDIKDIDKYITREFCVYKIMQIVGIKEENNEYIKDSTLYRSYFSDQYTISEDIWGYVMIAAIEEVVKGYPDLYRPRFKPHQNVSPREAITYIMRCLCDDDINDLDTAIEKAKEIGFIGEEDYFIESDEYLKSNDFEILLDRLYNERRYKYFCDYVTRFCIDETRSITYKEYLSSLYTEESKIE